MNRSQPTEVTMKNVTFLVSTRPGDDPEVGWSERSRRSIEVPVVDHRLGEAGGQIGLIGCAKMLAGEFVMACSNMLEDRIAVAAVEHQVLADIFQGLQEWAVNAGPESPVVVVYNKDYTDEDGCVFKFTVDVEDVAAVKGS